MSVTDAEWGFSSGPTWLRFAHIIVGYFALAIVVIQILIGMLKYRALTDEDDDGDSAYPIHETLGNLVYGTGMLNVVLGVWMWDAWSLPVRAAISLTLITSAAFGPRWDGSRGYLSDAPDPSKKKHTGNAIGKDRN